MGMSPGAPRGRHPPVIAYEVARESEPGRPPSAHLEAPGTAGSSRGTPSSPCASPRPVAPLSVPDGLATPDLRDDQDHVPRGQPVRLVHRQAVDPHLRLPVGAHLGPQPLAGDGALPAA